MNANPPLTHYPAAARWLHWLSVLAIAVAFLAMEVREEMAREHVWRPFVTQLHFWAGLSVLAMLPFRFWLHRRGPVPPIIPVPGAVAAWAARLTHFAIYLALLVQPLLGLFTAAADGKIVRLPFSDIALPPVIGVDEALAGRLEDLHGGLAEILLVLIGLHVLAALWHHFVRRDNTLRRMRRPPGAAD